MPTTHKGLLTQLYRNRVELDELDRRMSQRAANVKEQTLADVGYEVKALGTNEKEQQRKLEFAVFNDARWNELTMEHLEKRRTIAHLEAELDAYRETMKTAQWNTRLRMVRVLEGKTEVTNPDDRFFEEALNTLLDTNTFPQEEVVPATDMT